MILIDNRLIEPLAKLSCVQENNRPGALTKEQMAKLVKRTHLLGLIRRF